jgi:iron complex outermembrane receptor protein
MFGASFTDAGHNYDVAAAHQRGPIDPFDPVHTGVLPVGPVDDRPEMKFKQQSLYVQDQMVFRERIHLDLGLRYDWIETDSESWQAADGQTLKDDQPSFSAGLLYAMDNGLSPYVSYSESFLQEAFGTDAAGNAFEPTRGKQVEAGVKYQPPGTNALLTAAVFELTKSHVLVTDPRDPDFSRQDGEARSRGVELGAQGTWRGLTFDLAYTHLDTEDVAGEPLAGVPDDQASAWLQYAFAGRLSGLETGIGVRYVGSTISPSDGFVPEVETPSYTLYDAMVAYTWDDYRIALVGRNLADETYTVNCSYYSCYYGDPRTVALTLTAAF